MAAGYDAQGSAPACFHNFEINRRFMEDVKSRFPGDEDRLKRMSIVEDSDSPQVRMAWLAVVGSFIVNGVSSCMEN